MFDIVPINTGYFLADGGAMFGAIPKRAWSRAYPNVEDNLCRMAMRGLLAISDNRKILVDLGMGNKHLKDVTYYQAHQLTDIREELAKRSLKVEDITDVILSHLHFDHCGYATVEDETGKIVPTFPNAKYYLSKQQWENQQNPNRLEKDSMFANNIQPIKDSGQLYLIDDDFDFGDGCRLQLFDGHSYGQIVALFDTKEGTVAYPSDLIPTSAHVSLDWISAYDLSAEISLREKTRFLEEAVKNDYTLYYYHDAYVIKSKVKKVGDTYKARLCEQAI